MLKSNEWSSIIEEAIKDFSTEFLGSPYLCYTEHGIHALFYCRLYARIPENERYMYFGGKKVCIIQKEYPTADKLDKSMRSHWDVAVLQSPPEPIPKKVPPYDYLKVRSAIEFGMNETKAHLADDISRLSHPCSYVEHGYIVHLYRIYNPGQKVSEKDWSSRREILTPNKVSNLVGSKNVNVYYVITNKTEYCNAGFWLISSNNITRIM